MVLKLFPQSVGSISDAIFLSLHSMRFFSVLFPNHTLLAFMNEYSYSTKYLPIDKL